MCYNLSIAKPATDFEERYNATFLQPELFEPVKRMSGFLHDRIPVITHDRPDVIQLFQWGLLPNYARVESEFYKKFNNLNAKYEEAAQKKMWLPYMDNRCLVLSTGFFEHQHMDDKGKQKQLHRVNMRDSWEEPFVTMAGIFNHFTDRQTGEQIPTVTIYTLPANPFMAKIHNTKQRMPFILPSWHEREWLAGSEIIPEVLLESEKLSEWP